jgi:prepilin-type N-terminal cleavage/methylation domain-containing protein
MMDGGSSPTTQRLHALRTKVRRSVNEREARTRNAGFTLIELMTVLVILSIASSIAFVGFRLDQARGQTRRFIEDVQGVIIQARNVAIDEQRPVTVTVEATLVRVTVLDPITNVVQTIDAAGLHHGGAALLQDGRVCIYGLQSGVQAPVFAQDMAPPDDCVAQQQQLRFEPDGSFTDPNNTFATIPNAGASLWIADRSVPGNTRLAVIQIFPGGLIRSFEELQG